jgi:protein TonB
MRGLGWKAWSGALAASLAVHAAVVAGVRLPPDDQRGQSSGPTVTVSGQLAGVMGGAVNGQAVRADVAHASRAEPVQTQSPQTERARATPPASAPRARAVTPSAGVRVKAASAAPVVPVEPQRPAQVEAAPAVDVRPEPTGGETAPPPPVPAPEARPTRTEPAQARRREPTNRPARTERQEQAAPASRRGTNRQGAAGRSRGGGKRTSQAGAGAVSGYGARVRARILANRPSASGVGRAVVTFGVASSGGLRFVRLARSSGDGRLDQAALAAVRRSSPFPTPPAGASAAQLTFTIGLSFR